MGQDIVGFIGAGNMATALIKGLIDSGLYPSGQLRASDRDAEKLKRLSEQFAVEGFASNRKLVEECEIIFLSVKPQSIREVLEEVKDVMRRSHLVVSIAAGIPIRLIRDIIGRDLPIIRVMPNTPALVQKGMSALAPGELATPEHMEVAKGIFDAVGETVIVQESMMDAVTAISGSGPGYLFKIMECFVEAGEGLGFDRDTSLRLVVQTVLGAAYLANESSQSLARLREMVTSPGGTTAAGLGVLDQKDLGKVIREAVEAACKRSVELGKNY